MPTPRLRELQERFHNDVEFRALCKLRASALGRPEVRPYDLYEVSLFYDMLEALNLRVAPVVLPLDAPMMFTGNVVVCGVCRATFSDPDAIVRAQQHSWNDHSWLRPIMQEPAPEPHAHCDNDPIECSVQALQGEYEENVRKLTAARDLLRSAHAVIRRMAEAQFNPAILDRIKEELVDSQPAAEACPSCGSTGAAGRVPDDGGNLGFCGDPWHKAHRQ